MPTRAASRSILAYTFLERPIHCINTRLFTTHSAKLRSHTTIPDCPPESLYTYSARRWLWDEPDQLQRRYVRFNINALIEIAEKAAGHDAVCVDLSRLPEGNSNKIFLATMSDGQQIIVKIPNPNAGPKHYTTASEVATMSFARDRLNIPVPTPLDYCTDANRTNLGAEYIVMEKAPGVELSHIWDELKGRQKVSIVEQIADISCKLARARFPAYGALYKRRDVGLDESVAIDDEFVVGRTLGRAWFEDGRGHVDIHRGPWSSVEDLIKTVAQREAACIDNLASFRRDGQQGIFGGPGGYIPTKEAKKSVLRDFLKICSYIRPKLDALSSGILWHNDLHTDNIFVDAENPSQITSIVDWQGVSINPIFLTAQHPFLIDHEGPKLEGLAQPALPETFDSLAPAEQMAAKRLFLSQTLWALYEVCIQRAVPELLQAFRHKDTLQGQILGLIGAIYDDGEPYVQSLLADIAEEDIWKQVVGEDEDGNPSIPCPIWYSEQDKERQKTDLANWERDVERKSDVLHEIGLHAGWDGAVAPGDYDEVVRRLAAAKQRFLDRESGNEQERARWEKVWPFQDTTG